MTSAQIRQSFLDFFREKKHTIVSSSSLLPDAPNLLFTNAGMNQFVPIFLGQQKPPWKPPRVADTQKCTRAGGKHNDLEDVGLDTYHHTFFEMLGNWSFGDYFKKEAIEWAWELLVERWKFPAQRLYATVYCPHGDSDQWERELDACIETVKIGTVVEWKDEVPDATAINRSDRDTIEYWAKLFIAADLDPKRHIVLGSRRDNFWMMGDTGPCGPCSEVHVDLTPDGDTRGALVNKEDPRCIEIWNLVFIQFNANPDGTFTSLPQRHVDTGMGFERVTAIIQGTKNLTAFSGTTSNYETDIFRPIFDDLEKLSGKKYESTLPAKESQQSTLKPQQATDIAFRVIADHIRALSFAIADGIIPSNEGRGYVLRRILRRAVRYGRTLGFHEPFFFKLVDVVAENMGDVFPEVRARKKNIQETIRREEEAFNKTLDKGIELFEKAAALLQGADPRGANIGVVVDTSETDDLRLIEAGEIRPMKSGEITREISGAFAFRLYDEQGFPLDLTQLMARERGLSVDMAGFKKLLEEQRARGRAAQRKKTVTMAGDFPPTTFVGYDCSSIRTRLFSIEGDYIAPGFSNYFAIVDESPLYAEMGGQVGDKGIILRSDGSSKAVLDTVKRGETYFLDLGPSSFPQPFVPNEIIEVKVDVPRRQAIERHHTVTHLLHWALHQVVSRDAAQKGSYVGPDKLTFDFSSAALTKQQIREVEKLVNEKIVENAPVSWTEIPYAEAKQRKDIIQFFGQKYGDTVRVLQIGGAPTALNGYSMELCGGTHVRSTKEIGPFRIVKEEAIAAGIRRIEALAGDAARKWAEQESARQKEKFATLARKKPDIAELPVFESNADTAEMLKQLDARAAYLEKVDADVREWEKKTSKAAEADLKSRAAQIAGELTASHAGKNFCVSEVPNADGKLLQAVVDALKPKFKGPIFLIGAAKGSVASVASVPKEMTSKFQANKIIQEIAPIVGGKGGGRSESAQGGGTDPSKVGEALAKARELLS